MDLDGYLDQYKGREIVAYSGRMKYRGVFEGFLEGGFLLLSGAVVMNTTSQETSEFASCILNVREASSIVVQ